MDIGNYGEKPANYGGFQKIAKIALDYGECFAIIVALRQFSGNNSSISGFKKKS